MPLIPQAKSSYAIEETCQIENLGYLLEQLPKPFGKFDRKYKGTFVEVGSFDGPTYSNVWQFVKSGWRGIMIEPMPENLEVLNNNLGELHPHNVIVKPFACGSSNGVTPMFFEREGSRVAKPGELTHQIATLRLDDILDVEQWPTDFDVLVIDVEDQEQPVLRGFSLEKWRPKLCIAESHGWQRDWIHKHFEKLYRIYYENWLNTLFVRRDWSP